MHGCCSLSADSPKQVHLSVCGARWHVCDNGFEHRCEGEPREAFVVIKRASFDIRVLRPIAQTQMVEQCRSIHPGVQLRRETDRYDNLVGVVYGLVVLHELLPVEEQRYSPLGVFAALVQTDRAHDRPRARRVKGPGVLDNESVQAELVQWCQDRGGEVVVGHAVDDDLFRLGGMSYREHPEDRFHAWHLPRKPGELRIRLRLSIERVGLAVPPVRGEEVGRCGLAIGPCTEQRHDLADHAWLVTRRQCRAVGHGRPPDRWKPRLWCGESVSPRHIAPHKYPAGVLIVPRGSVRQWNLQLGKRQKSLFYAK